MALSTKELWMDFHNQNITRLCVVQNEKDTRKYNVHFCDEGIPIQLNSSDYELYIAEKKADGNKVLKACTINNDGTGLLVFDENMCISNGSAALQFILRNKKDNSWTRTIAFNARIHEAVLNNGDITSSTEFDVLSNLILKVEELDKVINDNEKIRQANEEVRKSNEVKRIDAENERISNENTRKSNETQRVNAENTRVKQENDRKTSEEKRINAENTRVSNENTRKANETQRQTNETTRTNAETKRVNAETDRQSKETARQQNENTRETNETTRQSNEKTRVSNETTRTNAESERIKNENTRISNENTRQTQETKRQNDTATAITNANNAAKNANDKANDLQDKLDNNYFVLTNELENSVSSTSTTHAPTAKAVKTAYDKAVSVENTINSNKSNWNDKYTKNEIDNKFSTLESNIDWKESVATFADIAKTYPNPEDGWTVNTKIDNLTYRYSGSAWVAISANAIPKATQSVDGLLAKEDKINYDDANSKKHTHSNKSILDNITSTLINTWNTVTNKLDKTGDASNTTTSFSTASIRSNISTGEKLAISLGKIAKWFSDLKNVAFTGSYNDLSDRPTVGNGTITIKQAGTNKGTFSMNQTGNTTIELSDNNTWRPVETLLTNQNLDAVVTPGFYNAGGGNTCANKPSGIDAFGLIVTHNAGGQYYTQMLFNNTGAISCRRYCISGTWGNWLEDKFTDTTYSNATTSTAGLMSPDDKTTLNNLKTGAVTGVKGSSESTYRTGNVNLTPANIGAVSIEDFNNLKIGGRNLVRNGDFAQGNGVFSSCWTNWGLPSAREYVTLNGKKWCHIKGTGTALHQGISQNTGILIEKNTQYTISARVKGSKDNQTFTLGIHWLIDKTISAQNWKDFIVNATDTLINVTFTSPNSDINTFNLMLGVSNTTTVYEVYFTDIKLEKGNKITAYSPAYEDYLPLNGGTVNGDIVPDKDETYDLGHEDKKWDNILAHTLEVDYVNAQDGIRGNLTGNADTATKAVKDNAGDNIITSYRKRMGSVPNNDFNNATVEGVYTYGSSTGIANSYTNGGIWGTLEVFNNGYNSTQGVAGTVIHQIAFTTNNQIYFRQRINASDWTLWKELTSKSSNGEIKVTNPTYSKGYVRAWVDSEGGNLEIQSPDGATTYQIDAYNNDIIRIFSNNSDGSHKFLKFNGKTGVLSADGGFAGNASTVNKHTVNADVPANAKFTDTNTTYSAGTGIGLSNTTFYNTGVRSIATGSTNGSVAVNTNGTVADVKVKGLNTLAYASGTWNKLTGTNCTLWYNEVAIYLEISAQNVNLTEYGGTATNKTIVVLPTNVTPTKGVFLGVISALNSAWMPLNKAVMCNINYNSHNLTLRPTEALSNVVLNLTAMFPRSLFTIT